jgi:hypothetical protein
VGAVLVGNDQLQVETMRRRAHTKLSRLVELWWCRNHGFQDFGISSTDPLFSTHLKRYSVLALESFRWHRRPLEGVESKAGSSHLPEQ